VNVIITGGAGFIGSNLCDLLLKEGHKVVIVDNLSTGHKSNILPFIDEIQFFREDVESFDFNKIINIDAVVHLAAQPSVPLSIENFSSSSSSNLLGAINVIDCCRIRHVPMIYASSSAIYGDLLLGNDESNEVDLLSPYSVDKYAIELYAKVAYKLYQLSSVGLRFFNVYGPKQDPGSPYSGVISVFADRILDSQDININGGHQTRDFVYVKDVVNIIHRAIILASKNTVCETSNVLTGKSITVDCLSDQMMDVIGVNVGKNYQDLPVGDPEQSDGTVGKMSRLFSIKTKNFSKLKEGLVETIQHIKADK